MMTPRARPNGQVIASRMNTNALDNLTADPTTPRTGVRRGHFMGPLAALWHREMVRFFRQRHRVVSAVATPVLLWVMLGTGMDSMVAWRPDPTADVVVGYRAYFFPGTLTMILLFTAIFSTITVIEDRQAGLLQGVLAAPVSRLAIVLGKVLGGTCIALVHGVVFLLLWPLAAGWPGLASAAATLSAAIAVGAALAVGLTAIGLVIAWRLHSTAGFHAVMMLFLMPMWFLSGAVFPMNAAPTWMKAVMWCNPMTYGQATLAAVLTGRTGMPLSTGQALTATLAVSAALVALAVAVVGRPDRPG